MGEQRFLLFKRGVAVDRPCAVVALGVELQRLLLFADGAELLFRAKARIGEAFLDELFGNDVIDLGAAALLIRPVSAAFLPEAHDALVGIDAERTQTLDDFGHAVFDLALFVGILDPQQKHAVGCGRVQLGDEGGKQSADMQKAGGTGRKARDAGAVLEAARRKTLLEIVHRLGNAGEQQGSELLIFSQVITFKRVADSDISVYYLKFYGKRQ